MSLRINFFVLLMLVHQYALAQENRHYDTNVLQAGQSIFQQNCAVCHGLNAEGTVENWQQKDAQGKLPPPPLNGTAHTWHHSINALMQTVRNGTVSKGGSMPAWKQTLSDEQIFSVIVWLSSLWPDPIYQAWMNRNQQ